MYVHAHFHTHTQTHIHAHPLSDIPVQTQPTPPTSSTTQSRAAYFSVTQLSWPHVLMSGCDSQAFEQTRTQTSCGSGLFLVSEDLERRLDHLIPACAFFLFFLNVEISSATLIPLPRPESVHSDSPSWDDCGQMFPDKLQVSLFPNWFPHYAWTTAVSPHRLCWVKGVCMFRCNLPPALLAEWPGSFMCHCGNKEVEWTLNKSQHAKVNSGEENSPSTPARIQTSYLLIVCPTALSTSYPGSHRTI